MELGTADSRLDLLVLVSAVHGIKLVSSLPWLDPLSFFLSRALCARETREGLAHFISNLP